MNPHTNYLAVGLFLVAGIAGVIILVVWLGKAGDATPRTGYVVEIPAGVSGLSNGSAVYYLGVNVGTVTGIELELGAPPIVDVAIEIVAGLPVNEGTYATLVMQGVTGIANVNLENDLTTAQPLRMHASGVPIIPFRSTGLAALLSGSGDLTTELRGALAQLNLLLGERNRARVEQILGDIAAVTETVAGQREEIPEIVASLRAAMESLERTAGGLENAVQEDLPAIAADLKRLSANMASASGRIDSWLADNDANVDRLLGEGLDAVTGLATDLRGVAEQLARLSVRLREDPSRLIYRAQHDPVEVEP